MLEHVALIAVLAVVFVFALSRVIRMLQRDDNASTFTVLALIFVVALSLGLILRLLGQAEAGMTSGLVFGAVGAGWLLRTVKRT
jgi:hypothetical protein